MDFFFAFETQFIEVVDSFKKWHAQKQKKSDLRRSRFLLSVK
jgi:hypothetical protein